jgi:glutaminyl-peptide cyclotransferase
MRASKLLSLCAGALLVAPGVACTSRLEVDGARAMANVRHQVEAGPRIPGTGAHRATGDWIVSRCEALGGAVERQCWTDSTLGRPLALCNFIARFGPAGGRRIALLAHWDTRPFSDQDPDPAHRADPVPGANDGASGVAVLLEVAELMRAHAPPIGVDLVFLDGEDQGAASAPQDFCLGARRYARAVSEGTMTRPTAAFLFDMVGDEDLGIWPEVQSSERAANLVAIVLDGAKATGARGFHESPKYTLTDDHIPLLEAGIPAVDVIDFDYPEWHTHLDTVDHVSAASLSEVARVAAWIVYRSALAHP